MQRVNDKFIENVSLQSSASPQSVTLYDTTDFTATVDRIILTGTLSGTSATSGTSQSVGILLVHFRPDTVAASQMSLAAGIEMWPDPGAVMYQGLWEVPILRDTAPTPLQIEVKGKRILRDGHSIQLFFLGTGTSIGLRGAVTIFSKLA